jgi:hypothetical protein
LDGLWPGFEHLPGITFPGDGCGLWKLCGSHSLNV